MADYEVANVRHPGHAATLKFTIGLCLCYTLCVACLRGFIRWGAYGIDDLFVLLSGISALSFFGIVFASISAGLGHSIIDLDLNSAAIEKFNDHTIAGNVLWIISLCVSKAAIVAMLLRTTQTTFHRRSQYSACALIITQCLTSILLLTVECSAQYELAWSITAANPECPQADRRWYALTALDVMTEALLLFLPIQLREILRLAASSDIPLAAAMVVIWQAIELSFSLAAATIAALKRFTESLSTGFGHGELMRVHGSSQGYKLSARSATSRNTRESRNKLPRSNAHDISIDTVSSREESSLEQHVTRMKLRPEALQNTAVVSSPSKNLALPSRKRNMSGSENNIIRQEVQYSVHYD
ncbi:hypothetical protein IG631_12033 [Alternaria alternata]|nr:hypothetical protein IG631_12033 [Alternaria alternata]